MLHSCLELAICYVSRRVHPQCNFFFVCLLVPPTILYAELEKRLRCRAERDELVKKHILPGR